jgi:glycosyltransferase involved in cell wall biosynthesis
MSTTATNAPLISVITVCLNAETHIARAMDSVLSQTYTNLEHIIVDGASADRTLEVICDREPLYDGHLTWISEPDKGLYDAMNKGVALARGGLIGILNADDSYESDALEHVTSRWLESPGAGVIHGSDRTIDAAGETRVRNTPDLVTLRAMQRDHIIHHHASFVTRETYERVGHYDLRHPIAADYDFFLRCAESGIKFVRVDRILSNFSLQGVSHHNVRATDRDATLVRIEHGVSPLRAWARFYKRAAAFRVYRRLNHFAWFREAYEDYRSIRA